MLAINFQSRSHVLAVALELRRNRDGYLYYTVISLVIYSEILTVQWVLFITVACTTQSIFILNVFAYANNLCFRLIEFLLYLWFSSMIIYLCLVWFFNILYFLFLLFCLLLSVLVSFEVFILMYFLSLFKRSFSEIIVFTIRWSGVVCLSCIKKERHFEALPRTSRLDPIKKSF